MTQFTLDSPFVAAESGSRAPPNSALSPSSGSLHNNNAMDSIIADRDEGLDAEDSAPALSSHKPTPLPKLQLSLLLYLQLAEPLTSTVIYPFVNQLVRRTGITKGNDKKTGFYVGLIESLFYAVEAISVLQWGRASDRLGRKPILIAGLCGLTLSMVGFGLSKTFWTIILSRCAQGALNGNIGVTKSMMGEITDASNMAQGFAFMPLVWSTGATLGPLMGGLLADPVSQYNVTSTFLHKYPYFLPCMLVALISISAAILTALFLEETVPHASLRIPSCLKKHAKSNRTPSQHSEVKDYEASNTSKVVPPSAGSDLKISSTTASIDPTDPPALESQNATSSLPTLRSLLVKRTILPILNYAFLAFVDDSFLILQPLVYSTSISDGGLGFSSLTIGIVMGVWGVISGVFQIFAFPRLMKTVGPKKIYIVSFASYLLCFGTFPVASLLAKRSGSVDGGVWAIVVLQLASYLAAYTCFGVIFIYITDGAPSRNALGATNGLAQTVASTMRAIAPSTGSSLFALSLEGDIAGGTLVYWVLMAVVVVGMYASLLLPKKLLSDEPGRE